VAIRYVGAQKGSGGQVVQPGDGYTYHIFYSTAYYFT
jgi:hypothetical protein